MLPSKPPDGSTSGLSSLCAFFRSESRRTDTLRLVAETDFQGAADISRAPEAVIEELNVYLKNNQGGPTISEVTELVESLGESYDRWCLLDPATLSVSARVILRAEECLERDKGLFRLIEALETLQDRAEHQLVEKDVPARRKDAIGALLVAELLFFFVDEEKVGLTRRWAGLLLAELLEGSEGNKERIWNTEKTKLEEVGDIIERGTDRMLKIVAGKIIWHSVRDSGQEEAIHEQLKVFWGNGDHELTKDFPTESGSQWDGGFARFVTRLEEDIDDPDIGRFPVAFNAYQVQLGEDSSQAYGRGAVSISIGEIFSVYVPPSAGDACEWLDLKIANIWKIEPTNDIVPGDIKKHLKYLKLHLFDYENDGHLYLMSMRPLSAPAVIMIACHTDEADDIVENIERCRGIAVSRIRSGGFAHISAVKGIPVNPEMARSQQEKEKELQKRLGYVVDAVNSPLGGAASSDVISSSKKGEEGGVSGSSGLEHTYDGRSGSMESQRRNRGPPKVQEASAARVSQAQETPSRGAPQIVVEDSIPTSLPLSKLPLPFPEGHDGATEEFGDQDAPTERPIPGIGGGNNSNENFRFADQQENPSSYGQAPRRSESAAGLVDFLNRVPSLVPLEALKKRGKLKDRLANKEGRVLQPSTEETHKSRGVVGNPKTPTILAKPERQKKRPSPLPEGDDIWDIPLDESEAERPAKRGRTTKGASRAGGKPPPRLGRQAKLPKPKPKVPANRKATTAAGSARAQPPLRRSLRIKAPPKTATIETSDRDLSEGGTAAPIQEPTPEARPPAPGTIQKPASNKKRPPKPSMPSPPARMGGGGQGLRSVDIAAVLGSGGGGPSKQAAPANQAQQGGKAEGTRGVPGRSKAEGNEEGVGKLDANTKRKAQTPSNRGGIHLPWPAETPGGSRERQRPMPPRQDINPSGERSPILEVPMEINKEPGAKTSDAVGHQISAPDPISNAASAAVGRLLQVQRRDMLKSGVRVIHSDEAEASRDAVGRSLETKEQHYGPVGFHDEAEASQDVVGRGLETKEKHPSPVVLPEAPGGAQNQRRRQPPRPEKSVDERERSDNVGKMHRPAPILVDASTSTTDLSDDRLIAGSSSRTSSPQRNPGDHKPIISQTQLPALGPNFAPPSAPVNLVDERLAKRPQVISWGNKGPENQGRTPETTRAKGKEREVEPLDSGGFGDRAPRLPERNPRPPTGRRSRNTNVLADGGEDAAAPPSEEKELLQPWIPARTGTGLTEVDENGSPFEARGYGKPPLEPHIAAWGGSDNSQRESSSEPRGEVDHESASYLESEERPAGLFKPAKTPLFSGNEVIVLSSSPPTPRPQLFVPSYRRRPPPLPPPPPEPQMQPKRKLRKTKRLINLSPRPSEEPKKTSALRIPGKKGVPEPRSSPPLPPYRIQRQQEPGNYQYTYGGNTPLAKTVFSQPFQTDDDSSEGGISMLKSRCAIVSFDTNEALGTALIAQPEQETSFSRRLREQGILKAGARVGTSGTPAEQTKAGPTHGEQSAAFRDIGGLSEGQGPMWDSSGEEMEEYMSNYSSSDGYEDGRASNESQDSSSDELRGYSEEEEDEGGEDPDEVCRESLLDHSLDIVSAALEEINQNLIHYLESSTELTKEIIAEFGAQGEKVIQTLADSHSQEHQAFLARIEEVKKTVARKTKSVKKLVERTASEIERGRKEMEGGKRGMEKENERLGDEVEKMLVAVGI